MNKYVATLFVFVTFLSILVDTKALAEVSNNRNKARADIVILENPIIGLIDNKSFGVTPEVFGFILQCRRAANKRLFGVMRADGTREGIYEFNGKKYCLVELAQIESEYEAEHLCKLNYLEKNCSKDELAAEKAVIESDYREKTGSLRAVFEIARNDFIEITSAYLESARGMKDPLLIIIKEFCNKKGLETCFLLDWAETEEGGEIDSIKRNMSNFRDLARLCIDMTGFLEAMARSCPKAKAKFIEMVRRAREKKEA